MTPDRMRTILVLLGWSQREMANQLQCSHRLVRKWACAEAVVPVQVGAWLEGLALAHATFPPPTAFRRPPGRVSAAPGQPTRS
jgi:transcriptional regulator with XRE-family HTH domain